MTPGTLFTELKRRHVLRVVGAYAVAAWIGVEVFTTIQPILLENHAWTNRLVVILALAGFPLTFALAWVFDITPQGVRRTESIADATEPAYATSSRRTLPARATGFFGLGILVAIVSVAAYAGFNGTLRPGGEEVAITSIAVLPFDDMSSAQDQRFFSEGIAEELLNRLTQVSELRVPARTSSFALADQNLDVRDIGRRLGVSAVLEGSVRREGDRVRVTATLSSALTGEVIWTSKPFEGDDSDIFALQDSIANAIVDALKVQIAGNAAEGERGTESRAAHASYLKGLQAFHERTDAELRKALRHFRDALDEDPAYADALAALAQTYAVLPAYGDFPVDTAVQRGYEAAAAALARNPAHGGAYAAMGQIAQNFEWDAASAQRYYESALETARDETTRQWYAKTLLLVGRYDDAQAQLDSLAALSAASAQHVAAYAQMMRGETERALATWRNTVRQHPSFTVGAYGHVYAAIAAGRSAEAVQTLETLGARVPARRALYAAVAQALRDPKARPAAVSAVRAVADLPASERAAWLMAVGDRDGALAALAEGFERHTDPNFPFILIHPLLASLRTEPAVRTMIDEIGIVLTN